MKFRLNEHYYVRLLIYAVDSMLRCGVCHTASFLADPRVARLIRSQDLKSHGQSCGVLCCPERFCWRPNESIGASTDATTKLNESPHVISVSMRVWSDPMTLRCRSF